VQPEVRIYTTLYCGYCWVAKALLARRRVAYEEIDCTRDPAARKLLLEKTGQRTVPQIFIGGVPIGGYDELSALAKRGVLDGILAGKSAPPSVI
jgi:glutaredoxin 3